MRLLAKEAFKVQKDSCLEAKITKKSKKENREDAEPRFIKYYIESIKRMILNNIFKSQFLNSYCCRFC